MASFKALASIDLREGRGACGTPDPCLKTMNRLRLEDALWIGRVAEIIELAI